MGGIRREVRISPDALKVLSLILNIDGALKPPANVGEIVLKFHPQLAGVPNFGRTPEYRRIANLWRTNTTLLKWLIGFYGGYREWNLKQCSPEEQRVVEAALQRYPTYTALFEGLDEFFRGERVNYHTTGGNPDKRRG